MKKHQLDYLEYIQVLGVVYILIYMIQYNELDKDDLYGF